MLITGEACYPNADASYNGGKFNWDEYVWYMTKNTVRFSRGVCAFEGVDDGGLIQLLPKNYPVRKLPYYKDVQLLFSETAFWAT